MVGVSKASVQLKIPDSSWNSPKKSQHAMITKALAVLELL